MCGWGRGSEEDPRGERLGGAGLVGRWFDRWRDHHIAAKSGLCYSDDEVQVREGWVGVAQEGCRGIEG